MPGNHKTGPEQKTTIKPATARIRNAVCMVFDYLDSSIFYSELNRKLNFSLIAGAVSQLLRVTGKRTSRTAIIGKNKLTDNFENLVDLGFGFEEFPFCFRDGLSEGPGEFRPISEFNPTNFDVVLLADEDPSLQMILFEHVMKSSCSVIEINDLIAAHIKICKGLNSRVAKSCLPPAKLALVCAAVYLSSRSGCVIEAGVFKGGTTIYISKLQKYLGIKRPIYALDTFTGLPAPSEDDMRGGFVWDEGAFNDTSEAAVKRAYRKAGVSNDIYVIKGLIQDTIEQIFEKESSVSFMLLDTDQYNGTFAGLKHGLAHIDMNGLILIDDTSLEGVKTAIAENINGNDGIGHGNLIMNFDVVFKAEQ